MGDDQEMNLSEKLIEEAAKALGIADVVAGPFVRSSYKSHPLEREKS